jgi:CheY-like chemotaxis protein
VCSSVQEAVFPFLYVDDNADDRLLVQEAIVLTETPLTFYGAGDIDSAVRYFQFQQDPPEGKEYPRPALVLLDYDLGCGKTGADFLYWLRLMKKLVSIPVVMFSGSPGTRNVAECYEQGANYFLRKAMDLTRLKLIVRTLHDSIECEVAGPILRLAEYVPDPRIRGASVAKAG